MMSYDSYLLDLQTTHVFLFKFLLQCQSKKGRKKLQLLQVMHPAVASSVVPGALTPTMPVSPHSVLTTFC